MTLELSRSWRIFFILWSNLPGDKWFLWLFQRCICELVSSKFARYAPHIHQSRALHWIIGKKLIVLSQQCEKNNECKGSSKSAFIFQFIKHESTWPRPANWTFWKKKTRSKKNYLGKKVKTSRFLNVNWPKMENLRNSDEFLLSDAPYEHAYE